MAITLKNSFVPACICCLALTAGAAPAMALADLVINVDDSRITPGTCDEASSLVTGRIAIKNEGEDKASMKVTERFTRSLLAVYVPQNIDMIDKKSQTRQLDPFDQEGIPFDVGAGIMKKGRLFSVFSDSTPEDFDNKEEQSRRNDIRSIQRALDKIGFDPGTIDGITGRNTRAAIREFQESIGSAKTGTLTDGQRRILFDKAGNGGGVSTTVTSTYGARGEVEVTLYAVVDPYNLVDETNEANNLQVFKFTIDCGN